MRHATALVLAAMLVAPPVTRAQTTTPEAPPPVAAAPQDEQPRSRALKWTGITLAAVGGLFALGSLTFNDAKGCGFFNELSCEDVAPVYRSLAAGFLTTGVTLLVIDERRGQRARQAGQGNRADEDEKREQEEEEEEDAREDDAPAPGRALIWTGVGLLLGGGLLLGSAIQADCETCRSSRHDRARAVVIGTGATSAATGLVLMTVGLDKRRAARQASPGLETAATAARRRTILEVGPRFVGVRVLF